MFDLDNLPLDQLTWKTSHNTYEHGGDFAEVLRRELAWDPQQPAQGACRGIELDIIRSRDTTNFGIRHEGTYSSTDLQLPDALGALENWARSNPGHDPVVVLLDIKNASFKASYADALDACLRGSPLDPVRILTPGALVEARGAATLLEAVDGTRGDWPTLAEARGKFLLCLSGLETVKSLYAQSILASGRPCFADQAWFPARDVDPLRPFINVRVSVSDPWSFELARLRRRRGLLFRAYSKSWRRVEWIRSLCNQTLWGRLVDSGFNMLATDCVTGRSWARVGAVPFARRKDLVIA